MSNWKSELVKIIEASNGNESELSEKVSKILTLDHVQNELKNINQWKVEEAVVHCTAQLGLDTILTKLLDAGANPNAFVLDLDEDGKFTPIFSAVLGNRMSTVKILIQYGADEYLESKLG